MIFACLLHEFLCEYGLYLVNTFAGESSDRELCTRFNWDESGGVQIDFLACPLSIACDETDADRCMEFTTDHRLVRGLVLSGYQPHVAHVRSAPRNWQPSESWTLAVEHMSWELGG